VPITLEELEIKFTAQFGGLQGQLDKIKGQMAGVEKTVNNTSKSFATLGRMARTFLTMYVGRAMIGVGKDSLAMANEVYESENLFAESMKGMSAQAREWSDNLRDNLGLNAYSLRRNIGTMNVMLKSMGIGADQAYEMSENLTMLAEDMASFYNLDPGEMFGKLQSGMTGMGMPLKQLGILVDEHIIKQYAMARGISKTGKELTQQEKVLARYAAIMAQTSAAQGDLARTISSPANQLRYLSNTVDQAKVAFGQAMQRLQAAAMPVLTAIADAALTASQAIAYLAGSLGGFNKTNIAASLLANRGAKTADSLAEGLQETAKAYRGAGVAARKAGTDIKQAAKDSNIGLKHFDEVNKLTKEAVDGLDAPKAGGGAGLAEGWVPEIDNAEGYADALGTVSVKVREFADKIKKAADVIIPAIAGIGAGFLAFKLTGNPAIAAVVGVLASGVTAITREIDRINSIRWSKAFGDIEISLEEAATIVRENMATKRTKLFSELDSLRNDTDAAMQRYTAAEKHVKRIIAVIEMLPMTTGKERFLKRVNEVRRLVLKSGGVIRTPIIAYIETLFAEGKINYTDFTNRKRRIEGLLREMAEKTEALETTIISKVNAALMDGKVDDSEKADIVNTLTTEGQRIVDGWEELKAEIIDQINADLKAGKIDETTAQEKIAETEANIQGEIDKFSIQLEDVKASIDTYKWTAKTLTKEQAEQLRIAVQEMVAEAGVVAISAEAEVTGLFTAFLGDEFEGSVGETAIGIIYGGAEQKLREANAELQKLFAEGFEFEFTPELVQAVTKSSRTVDEVMNIIAGGISSKGLLKKAEHEFALSELSKTSVDNLIKSLEDYIKTETERIDADLEIATNLYFSDPTGSLERGLAEQGLTIEDGIAELKAGAEEELRDLAEGKIMTIARTFMPSLNAAINSGELSHGEIQEYRKRIDELIAGVDFSALSDEAQIATLQMMEVFLGTLGPSGEMQRLLDEAGIDISANMESIGKESMDELRNAMLEKKLTPAILGEIILNPTREALYQLADRMEKQGNAAGAALVRSLAAKAPEAGDAAAKLRDAATNEVSSGSGTMASHGNSFAQGFINAINSKGNLRAAIGAARSLANAAKNAVQGLLSISSPSKVSWWLGDMFALGFSKSILAGIPNVVEAAKRLSHGAANALQEDLMTPSIGLSTASSIAIEAEAGISGAIADGIRQGVAMVMDNLKLSWNVDGVQYGRMTIQHMNNAQRMAGRVLLEM
jgi:hypothetical protein